MPPSDDSPPSARIVLSTTGGEAKAEAVQPPEGARAAEVELDAPRLRGTVIGTDFDGGVARVRVSIKETITCRADDGRTRTRPRVRYFPPPQVERIRSNPGASLPAAQRRTLTLNLAGDRCGDARAIAVRGELWGEAINGSGLEAVTPHLRFRWAFP